jgi:hypothetical protein
LVEVEVSDSFQNLLLEGWNLLSESTDWSKTPLAGINGRKEIGRVTYSTTFTITEEDKD